MKARLAELGYDPVGSTPEQFGARIKTEIGTWAQVIRAAHIKPE
jgi:tripartite-type tricarboxylate transporter receptor subunit TctC